jgi:Family of unknown function (DUF5996)
MDAWPELPLVAWKDTLATLHRYTQVIGKVRLELAPMMNHWWQVALYVTARGLTTSPIPYGQGVFEVDFDFVDHELLVRTSDGDTRHLPLSPRSVAEFYRDYLATLRDLDIVPRLHAAPNEMSDAMPFEQDRAHASYDPDAAQRCWRILVSADQLLKAFRGRFIGKCSPSHFFWGGFDLACTRFSGRPAPRYEGQIPNCPNYVMVEAYSHEVISAGWWPGSVGSPVEEAAFYAYAYPEPVGCPEAPIQPEGASYNTALREWILPYEKVRTASDPHAAVLDFLQSTYDAAATLGKWDRPALERRG